MGMTLNGNFLKLYLISSSKISCTGINEYRDFFFVSPRYIILKDISIPALRKLNILQKNFVSIELDPFITNQNTRFKKEMLLNPIRKLRVIVVTQPPPKEGARGALFCSCQSQIYTDY